MIRDNCVLIILTTAVITDLINVFTSVCMSQDIGIEFINIYLLR